MSTKVTDNLETLPERVDRIEQKLDSLTVSVDRRFDQVTEALVEQRQYTEFAFDRLRREMVERFDRADQRLDRMDQRFERMDHRFDRMDQRFDRMDQRFNRMGQRFDRTDQQIELVDQKVQILNDKLDRVLAIVRPVRRRARPKKR